MKYKNATLNEVDAKFKTALLKNYDKEKKLFTLGMFLTGDTGRGKTHALNAIRHMLKDYNKEVSHVENWTELLFELKDRMTKGFMKDFLQNLCEPDVIIIDDVGAERQSEWSQEMFYLIINRVYEGNKILFISTNLSPEQFTEKYGQRLISRLLEMCDSYELTGADRRIKK